MNWLDIAAAAVPLAAVYGGTFAYQRTPRARVARALNDVGLTHYMHVKHAHDGGPYGVLTADINTVMPIEKWWDYAPKIAQQLNRHTPLITPRDKGVRLQFLPAGDNPDMTALTTWDTPNPQATPNLRGLPIARDPYGNTWRMPVLGAHWLVLGATGSGKGSVIWFLITGLAPAIRAGTVKLWGVDPKGGVELGFGEVMFDRLVYNGADPAAWETNLAALFAAARTAMDARLERMRGTSRLHEPTPDEPLIVLVVDEFLTLTLGIADRTLKTQSERDLIMVLSKGRAAGVTVIACAQLAQKDALSANLRDLFPYRVGLRMTDAEQARMALGGDAVRNGAECHRIPDTRPGAAYIVGEKGRPRAVRFPWTSDTRILEIAREYRNRPTRRTAPEDGPSKKDTILALHAAHPEWEPTRIAQEAGCSDRWVRQIIRKAATT